MAMIVQKVVGRRFGDWFFPFASGVMYLRLIALLALFNQQLMALLALPFLVLAAVAIGIGWLWSQRPED
jgi:uncharacterized membrane protein